MIMKHSTLAIALGIIVPFCALGLGGTFSSPQLQFPEGATQETITKVINYLRNDLTFVEGSFINEYSSEGLSGSTKKVSSLIQLLQASGFELTVGFADLKNDRIAVQISQDSRRRTTTLTLNTARKDFAPSDLTIHLPASRTDAAQSLAPGTAPPPR